MKKLKFVSLIILLLFCAALTACSSFTGYEDNAAIVKGGSFSTVKSVSSNTSSKYTLRCDKCNGVNKIKNITVPDNPVFDIKLTVNSGRFKVVLVKDSEVFVICDGDTDEPVTTDFAAGTYSLRIVAEDAKVNFTFNFNSYN